MRYNFINNSIESYLEPKSEDEIVRLLSDLSKNELDMKLIYTAEKGLTNVVKYIIKVGADINNKEKYGCNTALHEASYGGHEQIVKMLINAGADVNTKNDDNQTPLHWASAYRHASIVKMLLKAGADVNAKSKSDRTALHRASQKPSNENVIKTLIDAGADVNVKDENGFTPLHLASYIKLEQNVKILKLKGAKE